MIPNLGQDSLGSYLNRGMALLQWIGHVDLEVAVPPLVSSGPITQAWVRLPWVHDLPELENKLIGTTQHP
jgi:hypothetical protein